mmetsp:Transcript_38785/g.88158  ORF Transcript_38785/g.88158 Transcript_38785/m.88158 type:complete len:227 (+) Transcript_38785:224-904(+)
MHPRCSSRCWRSHLRLRRAERRLRPRPGTIIRPGERPLGVLGAPPHAALRVHSRDRARPHLRDRRLEPGRRAVGRGGALQPRRRRVGLRTSHESSPLWLRSGRHRREDLRLRRAPTLRRHRRGRGLRPHCQRVGALAPNASAARPLRRRGGGGPGLPVGRRRQRGFLRCRLLRHCLSPVGEGRHLDASTSGLLRSSRHRLLSRSEARLAARGRLFLPGSDAQCRGP